MIYYPATGELAVCAKTKGELMAYSVCLGKHCFGDEQYFDLDGKSEYTLDPLMRDGQNALFCGDVPGIQGITLREIHIEHGTDVDDDLEIRRSGDVFESLSLQNRSLLDESIRSRVIKAKFHVRFAEGRARTLTIELPNIAHYDRESDHELLNSWLVKRGFVVRGHEEASHENDREQVLAIA